MKIDDLSNNIGRIHNVDISVNKNIETDEKNQDSGPEKSTIPGERVELSGASIEFSKAAEYMDGISKDRIQKIEELKMKVSNGSYDIEGSKIAESIIKDILTSV